MTLTQPLHKDLTNPHYTEWLAFLASTEHWNRQQIEDYQLAQLQRVVSNAYEHSRGYRELYKTASIEPADIQSLEDAAKLPFIDKETLRDRLEDFTADKRDADYVTTGGSTGIPFGFYRNKDAFGKELASKAYQYYRVGWWEGVPQLVLRGIPIDSPDQTQFVPEFNELRCSSYHLTPEHMEVFREKAFAFKPEFLKCYPSSGYLFASYLEEQRLDFPKLKAVLCASENLYGFQKNLMQRVFKTRIFSHYGHYELAALAGFCEYEDTYHVLPQYGYAELIDAAGKLVTTPGETGEIVATSFLMQATPFIRYRTRDFAVLKGWECERCKRPYQVWERIEGRLQEFIVTAEGRLISMTAINMHDDTFDGVKQFQFYQEEKGAVEFRYVPKAVGQASRLPAGGDSSQAAAHLAAAIKSKLVKKFGSDVALTLREVEDILPTTRGKHRFLIQKLPLEHGDVGRD